MDEKKITGPAILVVVVLATIFVPLDPVLAFVALAAMLGVAAYAKRVETRDATLMAAMFFVFVILSIFYLTPSIAIAKGQGTVLSDNWFQALTWIKDNTRECAVIATYWDPGHFITGIAERSVVFDGASQDAGLYRPIPEGDTNDGVVLTRYDNGAVQIEQYNGPGRPGIIRRARIKDIAISLFTDNETQAADILHDYAKPGCDDEVYFIASADLIGKSTWWTYFSTWDPASKGKAIPMNIINLQQTRPLAGQDAIIYLYPLSQEESFALIESGGAITPYLQQGNQYIKVEKLFYFNEAGEGVLATQPDSQLPGLLWLDPSRQAVVYIPPEIESSMFTNLFFFHGQGLQHFEFVQSWGGEVKLFRVKFGAGNSTSA